MSDVANLPASPPLVLACLLVFLAVLVYGPGLCGGVRLWYADPELRLAQVLDRSLSLWRPFVGLGLLAAVAGLPLQLAAYAVLAQGGWSGGDRDQVAQTAATVVLGVLLTFAPAVLALTTRSASQAVGTSVRLLRSEWRWGLVSLLLPTWALARLVVARPGGLPWWGALVALGLLHLAGLLAQGGTTYACLRRLSALTPPEAVPAGRAAPGGR